MADIKLLFHVDAPIEKVYEALSTLEGLANWWTKQTSGETTPEGVIQFRFGTGGMDMRVKELKTNESITWQCVAGADEWIGTTIKFELDTNDGKTRVRFSHAGWKEANDFFANCSFSWGRYMESLRQLCQSGKGQPFGA